MFCDRIYDGAVTSCYDDGEVGPGAMNKRSVELMKKIPIKPRPIYRTMTWLPLPFLGEQKTLKPARVTDVVK